MIFGSSIIMRWLDRYSKNSGHLFDIGKGGQERFCLGREITNRAISSVTQETTEWIPWEDEQNYECEPRPCWQIARRLAGGVLMTVLFAFKLHRWLLQAPYDVGSPNRIHRMNKRSWGGLDVHVGTHNKLVGTTNWSRCPSPTAAAAAAFNCLLKSWAAACSPDTLHDWASRRSARVQDHSNSR